MRKLSGYFVLVLVAAWLAAGCAWVKQDAKLQLNPQIARSEIGAGRRVAVRVQDRRTTQVLGYRGMDSKNAAITCGQDLAALFEAKIVEGMEQKGFTVARVTDQRPDVVNIDIRQIEYTTDLEFMKGSMQMEALMIRSLRLAFGASMMVSLRAPW